jgi:inorganic pyrophosphatase
LFFDRIPPRDGKTRLVNVVIDAPRGSPNKFKFDEELGCFKLRRILPAGQSFPYDFGSIPGTKGQDGDALDVLVVMDEPAFPGCLLRCGSSASSRHAGRKRARPSRTTAWSACRRRR